MEKIKILVIRFSSIGDIVLTTPVVRCLKMQRNAEIHYLTKENFIDILNSNPYIDKIYSIKKEISPVLEALKREKYDYIIDLHHNLRTFQVKMALLGVKSYSFDKINFQKWLMVNLKWNILPKMHIVDRYMQTVVPLGVQNDGKGLDYFIPAEDEEKVLTFLKAQKFLESQNPQDLIKPYIAFVLGATHATKKIPTKKVIAAVNLLKIPVLLLGGKTEMQEAEEIMQHSQHDVVNTCGQFTLHQSSAILKYSEQVITNDTGLMHIAAALGKNIISVWGNTIPDFGMYPYLKNSVQSSVIIEAEGVNCRPCSKIGYSNCPKKHFNCMENIDIQEIIENINQ